ncbi:MAG: hypothetical protein H6707_03965 [Deltaproteobacteria bacterium]|nr:hypothetical protein [Deltaproteobacteria bacterium]
MRSMTAARLTLLSVLLGSACQRAVDTRVDDASGLIDSAFDARAFDGGAQSADAELLGNGHCIRSQWLSLSTLPARTKGSTAHLANEFGDRVDCGRGKMLGAQAYYRVRLYPYVSYTVRLTADFEGAVAYLAQADGDCDPDTISAACSGLARGGVSAGPTEAGQPTTLRFRPARTQGGDYLLVVDSLSAAQSGKFLLEVEATGTARNDRCENATLLDLSTGSLQVRGGTDAATDALNPSIRCGSGAPLIGGQVFYRAHLSGRQRYQLIASTKYRAHLYVVSASCDAPAIERNCTTGLLPATVVDNETRVFDLSPQISEDVLVVVGGIDVADRGGFAMTLRRVAN